VRGEPRHRVGARGVEGRQRPARGRRARRLATPRLGRSAGQGQGRPRAVRAADGPALARLPRPAHRPGRARPAPRGRRTWRPGSCRCSSCCSPARRGPRAPPATARAIAEATERSAPLFPGPEGRARTTALLVAVAYHESRFRPDVVGDRGRSFGLFQLQRGGASNVDPAVAAPRALASLRASMRACRDHPEDERLAAYALGRCDRGLEASRDRARLGRALFAGHPPPEPAGGAP
jgi:hypothetical protein